MDQMDRAAVGPLPISRQSDGPTVRLSADFRSVGMQVVDVVRPPCPDALEHRRELPADVRQAVLDARRHLRIDRAAHDALALERLELRGQRRMRDLQPALELIEAPRALTQLVQHENRPLPLQNLLRRHKRADAKQIFPHMNPPLRKQSIPSQIDLPSC